MNKLIYLLIPLALGLFSCNRKSIYMTNRELKETLDDVQEIIDNISTLDTLGSIYYKPEIQITTDTGDTNRIRFYDGTGFHLNKWEPTLDTSDVIIKYVYNWEEGEIETLTGKIVYPTSRFGTWLDVTGKSPDSKFFKVKDGVWIPVEWPKDIVNVYIRPKK